MHDTDAAALQGLFEELIAAGGEIVIDDNFMAILQESIRQIAADESGTPGHEVAHQITFPKRIRRRPIDARSGEAWRAIFPGPVVIKQTRSILRSASLTRCCHT